MSDTDPERLREEAAEEALDNAFRRLRDDEDGDGNGLAAGRLIALIGILLAAGFTIAQITAMTQVP